MTTKPNHSKLYRASPSAIKAVDSATGVVEAIVSVFGIVDLGGDMISAGAFAKTLTERGMQLRVLDQHSTDSVNRVIGKVLEVREVGRDELPMDVLVHYPEASGGLYTKTQYLLDTPEGAGVFARIAAGAVSEFSIGFNIVQSEVRTLEWRGEKKNVRVIKEIKLWEYSAVIWGMNPATAVTSVKEMTASGKVQRIGHMFASSLIEGVTWRANYMMGAGYLTPEDVVSLNSAAIIAMQAFLSALPEELTNREVAPSTSYYDSADAPAEAKAGRVISASNETRIRAALDMMTSAQDSLQSVLENAGVLSSDDSANDNEDDTQTNRAEPPTQAGPGTPPPTDEKRQALLAKLNQSMT